MGSRGDAPDPARRTAVGTPDFEQDVDHWRRSDPRIAARLARIVAATLESPFTGIGKPEALRGNLSGLWSRRLTQEHRVVYKVTEKAVVFVRAYGHY